MSLSPVILQATRTTEARTYSSIIVNITFLYQKAESGNTRQKKIIRIITVPQQPLAVTQFFPNAHISC